MTSLVRRLRFVLGALRCTPDERAWVKEALYSYRVGLLTYSTDHSGEVARAEQLLRYGYRKPVPPPVFRLVKPETNEPGAH